MQNRRRACWSSTGHRPAAVGPFCASTPRAPCSRGARCGSCAAPCFQRCPLLRPKGRARAGTCGVGPHVTDSPDQTLHSLAHTMAPSLLTSSTPAPGSRFGSRLTSAAPCWLQCQRTQETGLPAPQRKLTCSHRPAAAPDPTRVRHLPPCIDCACAKLRAVPAPRRLRRPRPRNRSAPPAAARAAHGPDSGVRRVTPPDLARLLIKTLLQPFASFKLKRGQLSSKSFTTVKTSLSFCFLKAELVFKCN